MKHSKFIRRQRYYRRKEAEAYQEFLNYSATYCHCRSGICDGVLAGGSCDEIGLDDAEEFDCDRCGGVGVVNCYCGGDLCVCMNQGEMPCPDCEF